MPFLGVDGETGLGFPFARMRAYWSHRSQPLTLFADGPRVGKEAHLLVVQNRLRHRLSQFHFIDPSSLNACNSITAGDQSSV